MIEDAGFTTRDELVHGFAGGYLPPVLESASLHAEPGARARPASISGYWPALRWPLHAGRYGDYSPALVAVVSAPPAVARRTSTGASVRSAAAIQ